MVQYTFNSCFDLNQSKCFWRPSWRTNRLAVYHYNMFDRELHVPASFSKVWWIELSIVEPMPLTPFRTRLPSHIPFCCGPLCQQVGTYIARTVHMKTLKKVSNYMQRNVSWLAASNTRNHHLATWRAVVGWTSSNIGCRNIDDVHFRFNDRRRGSRLTLFPVDACCSLLTRQQDH